MQNPKPSLDICPLPQADEEIEVICQSISSSSNDDLEVPTSNNNNEQQATIEISNINTISHRTNKKKVAIISLISLALIGVIAGALTLSLNNNNKPCSSCNNNNNIQSQQEEEWDVSIGLYDILAPDFNDDLKPAVDDSDFIAEDYYVVDNNLEAEDCNDINCNSTAVSSEVLAQQLRISTISSQRACKVNEGRVVQKIVTDNYGFETSYRIVNLSNGRIVAQGPPTNTRYADKQTYLGVLCLPVGQYNLQMNDLQGDGMCCGFGPGVAEVKVNGKVVAKTNDGDWKVKFLPFRVTAATPPPPTPPPPPPATVVNDIDTPINNGKECSVVDPVNYNTKFQHGTKYQQFPGYSCYRSVQGTKDTVNDLLTKYPTFTRKVVLNDYITAQSKERLYVLVITNKQFTPSNNEEKSKMFVVSSIHANELPPAETMLRFAEYLLEDRKNPDIKWILDYTEIHLLIQANPDGRLYFERTGEGMRKNRNRRNCQGDPYGIDLNRNFPFKWNFCGDNQSCSSSVCTSWKYRGPSKSSEAETKAVIDYAKSIYPNSNRKGNLQTSEAQMNTPFPSTNTGIFIDVHSKGKSLGWPWRHKNEKTPNDKSLGSLGRKMASYGGWELWSGTPKMTPSDGGAQDYMYGFLGVPSFFFELGLGFRDCSELPTIVSQTFGALLYAAKCARTPYVTPLGPDILCTTISSKNRNDGRYINVQVSVSDNARVVHDDDEGALFQTGRQSIRRVEIYVNCHPYEGSTRCSPAVTKSTTNAGRTVTTSLEFKAPSSATGTNKNVMYIRARDSSNTYGAITAREFV